MKRYIIISLILVSFLLLLIVQITVYNNKKFNQYYEHIEDDFTLCNTNNFFNVTNAELKGLYMYDIKVEAEKMVSNQQLFDEIVSFTYKMHSLITDDQDNGLYQDGYRFYFYGQTSDKKFFVRVWVDLIKGHPISLEFSTNLYVNYSALNSFTDQSQIFLSLNSKHFTNEQIAQMEAQSDSYLFPIKMV